jgi:hypothetical protein
MKMKFSDIFSSGSTSYFDSSIKREESQPIKRAWVEEEGLVEVAWAEYCAKRGWTSNVEDGYTAGFYAYNKDGVEVYIQTFGE